MATRSSLFSLARASAEAGDRGPQDDTGKGKLVVADSTPADLENTVRILREHGYGVLEAGNGPDAVALIRSEDPDVAILDVRLDVLSGFQVIDHIRSLSNPRNEKVWNVPVIVTTNKLWGRDKQYAISLGVSGYFEKPIAPARVCSRIEKAIRAYRSR